MGSPDFAVPSLEALLKVANVVAVVTQPDKPSGRGREISMPPVKKLAIEKGLKIFQPEKIRKEENYNFIKEINPDLIIVAAYGKILPESLLKIPKFGAINVHASLLPKYRGASPISEAIIQGEKETGVTIMLMDEGMDTGDILSQEKIPIVLDDTTTKLSKKLSILGASLLIKTLDNYLAQKISPVPQDDSLATYSKILSKEDGKINWKSSAFDLERKIRAFDPWPGAWTIFNDKRAVKIKILKAVAQNGDSDIPGKVNQENNKAISIGCGGNSKLKLEIIQPENKPAMKPEAFALGHPKFISSVLE